MHGYLLYSNWKDHGDGDGHGHGQQENREAEVSDLRVFGTLIFEM